MKSPTTFSKARRISLWKYLLLVGLVSGYSNVRKQIILWANLPTFTIKTSDLFENKSHICYLSPVDIKKTKTKSLVNIFIIWCIPISTSVLKFLQNKKLFSQFEENLLEYVNQLNIWGFDSEVCMMKYAIPFQPETSDLLGIWEHCWSSFWMNVVLTNLFMIIWITYTCIDILILQDDDNLIIFWYSNFDVWWAYLKTSNTLLE